MHKKNFLKPAVIAAAAFLLLVTGTVVLAVINNRNVSRETIVYLESWDVFRGSGRYGSEESFVITNGENGAKIHYSYSTDVRGGSGLGIEVECEDRLYRSCRELTKEVSAEAMDELEEIVRKSELDTFPEQQAQCLEVGIGSCLSVKVRYKDGREIFVDTLILSDDHESWDGTPKLSQFLHNLVYRED